MSARAAGRALPWTRQSMVPVSTFPKAFRWCHYQLSLEKKGLRVSEGPRRGKNQKHPTKVLPNDEILDLGSIMFVIGLVQMLHFFMKS